MLLALILLILLFYSEFSMFRGDIAKAAAKNQAKKWLPITLGPSLPHSHVFSASASVRMDSTVTTVQVNTCCLFLWFVFELFAYISLVFASYIFQ